MGVSNNTEWLFFHLWKKNPETLLPCPNIYIAETILFRWAQPYFWYFTAKDGLIVRKTKEKVLLQQIEESFSNNVPKCGVMASCMTSYEDPQLKQQEKIEFEYIEQKNFHQFLFQREKPLNLIVQKFLEPKNGKNSIIKVSWTPQFCLFYRKTNLHDINSGKTQLINRLVTFEGLEHLSHSDSISSPILASELEQTCLNIVKHINSVTGGNIQISKMVLYFKLDEKNRLWLLFCTGLKVREKLHHPQPNSSSGSGASGGIGQKKKNERPLSPLMVIASRVDDNKSKSQMPSQYLFEDYVHKAITNMCLRCERTDNLYDVKMGLLLDHEEKVMKGVIEEDPSYAMQSQPDETLEERAKEKGVPTVMVRLYPTLTKEKYLKLKKNISLLNMEVKVCEDCYLQVTSNILQNTEEYKAKKHQTNLKETSKKQNTAFGFQKLAQERKQIKAEQASLESKNLFGATTTAQSGGGGGGNKSSGGVRSSISKNHAIIQGNQNNISNQSVDSTFEPKSQQQQLAQEDNNKKSPFFLTQNQETSNHNNSSTASKFVNNNGIQSKKLLLPRVQTASDAVENDDYKIKSQPDTAQSQNFYQLHAQQQHSRLHNDQSKSLGFKDFRGQLKTFSTNDFQKIRSPYQRDLQVHIPGKPQMVVPSKSKNELQLTEEEFNSVNVPYRSQSTKSLDTKTRTGFSVNTRGYKNSYGSVLSTIRDLKALLGSTLESQ